MKATEDALFAKLGISDRTPSAARRSTSGGTLFDDDEPPMPTPSRPAEYMWPPLPAEKKPLAVSGPPVAADDPLSAAAAAAAPPSAKPAAHPSPPNPLLAALTTPMPGFGSSDVAPPSWQLPRLSPLHPGEILLDRPVAATRLSVRLNSPATPRPGTLFLTNKRLLWEVGSDDKPSGMHPLESMGVAAEDQQGSLSVPLNSVEKLRKLKLPAGTASDGNVVIEVCQKYNARPSVRTSLSESDYVRLHGVLRTQIGAPTLPTDARANLPRCYAVAAGQLQIAAQGGPSAGWSIYDAEREFHRQGLNNPLSHWRVTKLNTKYELCATYPALLVIPRRITEEDLVKAAAFRSGKRFPALCWKDPFGPSSISRCSQPMVGMAKSRSLQDEALLQAIADTNPFVEKLQVIDCRPFINAQSNKIKGKGYEDTAHYPNMKLTFMCVENIQSAPSLPPRADVASPLGDTWKVH